MIIFHHQIFSITWYIWNITPEWKTLTITLQICSHLSLFFFLFPHSLHIHDLYQWTAFFLGFSTETQTCQLKILIKIYLSILRVIKNVIDGGSIFEHDLFPNDFKFCAVKKDYKDTHDFVIKLYIVRHTTHTLC